MRVPGIRNVPQRSAFLPYAGEDGSKVSEINAVSPDIPGNAIRHEFRRFFLTRYQSYEYITGG